ncbi:MAG: helix-turn-helix domain-containing protein [Acidimicrobiales bacterium]
MVTYCRGVVTAAPPAPAAPPSPSGAGRGIDGTASAASRPVDDQDLVFKAMADPTRRLLLDVLFDQDGRTLGDLELAVVAAGVEMTRFGVMKHLKVLEAAGLVVAVRVGREKHHHLNPVPIRLIHDRWIDKFTERHAAALADLKHSLEGSA